MTNDVDLELKQVFDERLSTFQAPERHRRSRLRSRLVVGVATASLVFAGVAFASDVNTVAAANGVDCANAIEKIQVWVRWHADEASHAGRALPTHDTDHLSANTAAHGECH
jgi:hypothetical protein